MLIRTDKDTIVNLDNVMLIHRSADLATVIFTYINAEDTTQHPDPDGRIWATLVALYSTCGEEDAP